MQKFYHDFLSLSVNLSLWWWPPYLTSSQRMPGYRRLSLPLPISFPDPGPHQSESCPQQTGKASLPPEVLGARVQVPRPGSQQLHQAQCSASQETEGSEQREADPVSVFFLFWSNKQICKNATDTWHKKTELGWISGAALTVAPGSWRKLLPPSSTSVSTYFVPATYSHFQTM